MVGRGEMRKGGGVGLASRHCGVAGGCGALHVPFSVVVGVWRHRARGRCRLSLPVLRLRCHPSLHRRAGLYRLWGLPAAREAHEEILQMITTGGGWRGEGPHCMYCTVPAKNGNAGGSSAMPSRVAITTRTVEAPSRIAKGLVVALKLNRRQFIFGGYVFSSPYGQPPTADDATNSSSTEGC